MKNAVLLFELFGRLQILAGIERDFVIGGIVLFRHHQVAFGSRQQLGDGSTAANIIGIHHMADTGTV
ncbi:hypothetical protein D3C78_1274620 [compost metagenome]